MRYKGALKKLVPGRFYSPKLSVFNMYNISIFGNNSNNIAGRKPKIYKYHVNQGVNVGKVKNSK